MLTIEYTTGGVTQTMAVEGIRVHYDVPNANLCLSTNFTHEGVITDVFQEGVDDVVGTSCITYDELLESLGVEWEEIEVE